MPRIKAFLVLTLLVMFSFSLFGCELIAGLTPGPEEVMTGQEGDLPEWLLLAHRSDESAIIDNDDDDLDDDSETLTPPPEQNTTPPVTTAPAATPAPETTQPAGTFADSNSPIGKLEISQAYSTLSGIETSFNRLYNKPAPGPSEADKREMNSLRGQYLTIISGLLKKYGITYTYKLDDASMGFMDGPAWDDWSPTGWGTTKKSD